MNKVPGKLVFENWKGYCGEALAKLGHKSVDEYIDQVRDGGCPTVTDATGKSATARPARAQSPIERK